MSDNKVRATKIAGKIPKFLYDKYNIDLSKEVKVKYVKPSSLIKSERIDLVAKIMYAKAIKNSVNTSYYRDLYKATIEAFSSGSYKEPDNIQKNSFEKYDMVFNDLLHDIEKNGFSIEKSIIPVTPDGNILDGAHRTSIAYVLNKKVPVFVVDKSSVSFDSRYFANMGLDRKYLDDMVFEYSRIADNLYVICLWPTCNRIQQKDISGYLRNRFKVVYEKDINFSYIGFNNFMSQIYYEQKWVGTLDDGYAGVKVKADLCYKEGNPTHIIVIEEVDINKVVYEKSVVRKKIGIGNHSIHSTDDKRETIRMLSLVLNDNSVAFLNNASPYRYKDVVQKIRKIKQDMESRHILSDDYVIGCDLAVSLYGLYPLYRNRNIIYIPDRFIEHMDRDRYDINMGDDKDNIDDLVYNPNNFFYFEDVKVMASKPLLDRIQYIHVNNKNDYKRIRKELGRKNVSFLKNKVTLLKRRLKHIKNRTSQRVKPILIKIGIYNSLRKMLGKKTDD